MEYTSSEVNLLTKLLQQMTLVIKQYVWLILVILFAEGSESCELNFADNFISEELNPITIKAALKLKSRNKIEKSAA